MDSCWLFRSHGFFVCCRMTNQQEKPVFVFDGDCGVCRFWMRRWRAKVGDRVDFKPFQEIHTDYPDIPLSSFRHSAKLIQPDGTAYHAAASIFKLISYHRRFGVSDWLYRHFPPFRYISEKVYRLTADHRPVFSRITRFFWGNQAEPPGYSLTTFIFLRAFAIICLIAFASLLLQLGGLFGEQGIFPIQRFLEQVAEQTGPERYWLYPTLTWISGSNWFLYLLAGGGVVFSVFLFMNFLPLLSVIFLWVLYLSFVSAGQIFLSYQWDILLLETGILAIFVAPANTNVHFRSRAVPSVAILWLFRWLNFRLLFESGIAKLASGDAAWHNLTALNYHYYTQPLPNLIAWLTHQLPDWFHQLSTAFSLGIEIGVPFLFFLPRRPRFVGAALAIFLQILIMFTGNYTFFNLLAITLALMLFDDAFWRSTLRKIGFSAGADTDKGSPGKSLSRVRPVMIVFTLLAVAVSLVQVTEKIRRKPIPLFGIRNVIRPLHLVNSYGLFANMTTKRPELIIQGSSEGQEWQTYQFPYKPDSPGDRPRQVAPHQPRVDWQLWFSALAANRSPPKNPRYQRWLINLVVRLLQGEEAVTGLLEENPFPNRPPTYIRILIYDYRFSSFDRLRKTGEWWRTRFKRIYLRPVQLTNQGLEFARELN